MNTNTLVVVGVSVIVAAALIAGLVVSGSPELRSLRMDQTRVNNLVRLSSSIRAYYQQADQLPASLDDLLRTQMLREMPRDPESGEAYTYEVLSEVAYRLCAEFALPSELERLADQFWAHTSGRQCYTIEVPAGNLRE